MRLGGTPWGSPGVGSACDRAAPPATAPGSASRSEVGRHPGPHPRRRDRRVRRARVRGCVDARDRSAGGSRPGARAPLLRTTSRASSPRSSRFRCVPTGSCGPRSTGRSSSSANGCVRAVLTAWDSAAVRPAAVAALRSAIGQGPVARMLREFLRREIMHRIATRLDERRRRAARRARRLAARRRHHGALRARVRPRRVASDRRARRPRRAVGAMAPHRTAAGRVERS